MNNKNLLSATADAETLGKLLGLSSKRIGQLADENRIPAPNAAGLYPLSPTVEKYCAYLRGRFDTATITAARKRHLEAKAALSELELKRKSGELVSVAEVERVMLAGKIAIREIICHSPLPKQSQDEILNELASFKLAKQP